MGSLYRVPARRIGSLAPMHFTPARPEGTESRLASYRESASQGCNTARCPRNSYARDELLLPDSSWLAPDKRLRLKSKSMLEES
jgi:hypothetical protein